MMFTDDVHSKYEILNHLNLLVQFTFLGGLFSGAQVCFFSIFCRRPTIVAEIFTHHENASYGPVFCSSKVVHFLKFSFQEIYLSDKF